MCVYVCAARVRAACVCCSVVGGWTEDTDEQCVCEHRSRLARRIRSTLGPSGFFRPAHAASNLEYLLQLGIGDQRHYRRRRHEGKGHLRPPQPLQAPDVQNPVLVAPRVVSPAPCSLGPATSVVHAAQTRTERSQARGPLVDRDQRCRPLQVERRALVVPPPPAHCRRPIAARPRLRRVWTPRRPRRLAARAPRLGRPAGQGARPEPDGEHPTAHHAATARHQVPRPAHRDRQPDGHLARGDQGETPPETTTLQTPHAPNRPQSATFTQAPASAQRPSTIWMVTSDCAPGTCQLTPTSRRNSRYMRTSD